MSQDDELSIEDASDSFSADFRDGQLQIVEVSQFPKEEDEEAEASNSSSKYMDVLEDENKGMMQFDLLNLTLVKCENGEEEYRLVANTESPEEFITPDSTVTCVLQSSDGEEADGSESYVMVEGEDDSSYVMLNGDDGPIVFLSPDMKLTQSDATETMTEETKIIIENPDPPKLLPKPPPTPLQLLERAKAVNRAKALINQSLKPKRGPGRRSKLELPSASELLSSPNFKLFLYSCRQCKFKCNATKELAAHRALEHGTKSKKSKYNVGIRSTRGPLTALQCARCPFRATDEPGLQLHVNNSHRTEKETDEIVIN